jgi:histidyl-tRNA synthetase
MRQKDKNIEIKVGELEIPVDYFSFSKEDKDALCIQVMDAMLHMLDKNLNPELNRLNILDKILESSIITNQNAEEYEICAVLTDIRNLINE